MMSQTARRRLTSPWALVAAAVVVLSCVGAAVGSLIARGQVAAGPTPPPAARSASPTPAIVVRLPDTLLGRTTATDRTLVASAERAAAAQRAAEPTAQSVQAAYYGSAGRKNLMFVLAVQARSGEPHATYERIVEAMQEQQKGLDLAEMDPGTLGGRAACGDAPVAGSPVTFCVWVDSGSYGFVEFFGVHSGPQRAPFLRVRSQIETAG